MKVADAIGAQLDWLVAKAQGRTPTFNMNSHGRVWHGWWLATGGEYERMPSYSTDWAQGGPITERECIAVLPPITRRIGAERHAFPVDYWRAMLQRDENEPATHGRGPTPLIAAMRCFCSKLGDVVDIPEELCQQQNS